jgi:hypothetical protein
MVGLLGFAFSMYSFIPLTHDWGAKELLLPQAFRGLAQQFAVAPTVTLTLGSLPPARLKLASGLFNLMRNLGVPSVSRFAAPLSMIVQIFITAALPIILMVQTSI